MKTILTLRSVFLIICAISLSATSLQAQTEPEGMTFEYQTDGLDTIFYLAAPDDTISERLKELGFSIQSTNAYNDLAKIGIIDSDYHVTIGHQAKAINKGLIGYHFGGIFDNGTIPNDSSAIDQWNWISELRPESVRIFSGSFSKFMHPLAGPGYGYDLSEIIRFYDQTDDVIDSITVEDAIDDDPDSLNLWMDSTVTGNFINFRNKWTVQNQLDSERRYIDDFIYLIKKIEEENPGHTVKIILCLNILSASATECADIVKYLRDNPIHDCTVEYVEMGNEMYYQFAQQFLSIDDFNDYWDYINGINITGLSHYALGDSVWNDHDYISAFKADSAFTCKVAIPARNLPSGYAFFEPELEEFTDGFSQTVRFMGGAESWNDTLATHYQDSILVIGTGNYVKSFDGVVLHPYYDDSNWGDIPDTTLNAAYPCINLGDADTTNDQWTYGLYDSRLEWAFDSITYNFRNLIKQRFLEYYDEENNQLQFYLDATEGGKELLTTEYNFKYDGNTNRRGVYTQSFMHGTLLFEWVLKNIKLNFDGDYRTNFFPYATVQNLAGAAGTSLMSPAESLEREFLGKDTIPYQDVPDSLIRNYHMKRLTFFAMELLSEITKENLRYVPSNFKYLSYANYANIQPTLFTNTNKTYLYLFYSNVRDTTQRLLLNIDSTGGFYPGGAGIHITDTATIYCVNALKPYSTSGRGKNSLYDLNQCYDDSILFPIEVIQIDTIQNQPVCPSGESDPLKCLIVPPYSFGYIKVPISPYSSKESNPGKEPDITIYPNPCNNYIILTSNEPDLYDSGVSFNSIISDVTGKVVRVEKTHLGQAINIAELPAGFYVLTLRTGNGNTVVKKFVKQ